MQTGVYLIVRSSELGITVKYDGINRVYVVPSQRHFGTGYLAGLCGNFNGLDEDDFRKSTNEITSNWNNFADSWNNIDAGSSCEPAERLDSCAKNPDRKAWAQRGIQM